MNKQELINQLEIKVKQWKAYPSDFHRGMTHAYKGALSSAEQLDEPQKPVVPQFVAEWFEDNKDDLEFAIWKLTIDSNSDYTKNKNEMRHWIQYAPNKPYKTLIGMLNGYEVEKEPLYSVIIAGDYLVKEISCSNEVKLISTAYLPQYLAHHYQLTEKQIKSIDERYWPFAVPVEEVVER